MPNKSFLTWGFGVLTAICVAEGAWIYRLRDAARAEQPQASVGSEAWSLGNMGGFPGGGPQTVHPFGRLFGDDTSREPHDPFNEIQKEFDTLTPLLKDNDSFFKQSWDQLFDDTVAGMDSKTLIENKGDHLVITMKIPGLKASSLQVEVNADRIKLSYDSKAVKVTNDGKGNVIARTESEQHLEKVVPVPSEADSKVPAKIETRGDEVRIVLEKKHSASLGKQGAK
jgi:HSP20 family molecular chaperone IbpA